MLEGYDYKKVALSDEVIDAGWIVAQNSNLAWDEWQKAEVIRKQNGGIDAKWYPYQYDVVEAEISFNILSKMASIVMKHAHTPFSETESLK